MEQKDRKIIDTIREGLLLCEQRRIKLMGNPYAALGQEPDHQELNIDANMIFDHLKMRGLV